MLGYGISLIQKPEDEEEAEELKEELKNFLLLKKIKEKKIKTKQDFEKACKTLCYESLAFCCDINKPCLSRNAVLDALKISLKDFRERKIKWHNKLRDDFVKK